MIPKSGYRFSEKIMHKQQARAGWRFEEKSSRSSSEGGHVARIDPMHPAFAVPGAASAVPIWFVTAATWPALRLALEPGARAFVDAAGFEPKPGRHLLLPGKGDGLGGVLFGLEADDGEKDRFLPGRLADLLPAGTYRFAN